jgi:dCTP deaminase
MSLLSYSLLVDLVRDGVIDSPIENINGASMDITLDSSIMIESSSNCMPVNLKSKGSPSMIVTHMPELGYQLEPGEFILASSRETFNLPNNIACEYKLKSSLARSGLQHLLAGWCDPGWKNSKLTLELKNVTSNHPLIISPGMKIGQMVFFTCDPVPDEHSYTNKGQYNNQDSVTKNKGLR